MKINEEKCPILFKDINCLRTGNCSSWYPYSKLAKQIEMVCLEEVDHGRLRVDEKAVEKFFDDADGDYWGVKAGVAWLQTKLHEHDDCIDIMHDDLSPIYKDLEINHFGPCIIYGLTYYRLNPLSIENGFRAAFGNKYRDIAAMNSYLVSEVVLPQHHDQYLPLFRISQAIRTQSWLYDIGAVEKGIHAYKHTIAYPDASRINEMRTVYMALYKLAQYIAPAYMGQYLKDDDRPLPKWMIEELFEFLVAYALEEVKLTKEAKDSFEYTHTEDTRSYERVLNQLKRRTSSKYDTLFTKLIEEDLHLQ